MFIALGKGLYGKVDHVPGLWYVATRFYYFQYLPIIPLGSVVVLDVLEVDGVPRVEIPIRWSVKSVLVAWLRAILIFGGICMAGPAIARLMMGQLNEALGLLSCAIPAFIVCRLSYPLTRAGAARTVDLAHQIGYPLKSVAVFFPDEYFPEADLARNHPEEPAQGTP
jgi:hypothetical protein